MTKTYITGYYDFRIYLWINSLEEDELKTIIILGELSK
jgi:hypothetical protein